MSTDIDIEAHYDGQGGYSVKGLTEAGNAFIKQHTIWHEAWGSRPEKFHFGCTGWGPFLEAAGQVGLRVRAEL